VGDLDDIKEALGLSGFDFGSISKRSEMDEDIMDDTDSVRAKQNTSEGTSAVAESNQKLKIPKPKKAVSQTARRQAS
jgi:hypothetical protein